MTAPNASRQRVAVSRRLYSSGTARWALARAAARIGPDFGVRARGPLRPTGFPHNDECPGPAVDGGRPVSRVTYRVRRAHREPRPHRPDGLGPRDDRRVLRAARDVPRGVRRRPARAALRRAEAQPPSRRAADPAARPPPDP